MGTGTSPCARSWGFRDGDTPKEAKSCVQDAVESYLVECQEQGILEGVLEHAGFEAQGEVWRLAARVVEKQVPFTDRMGESAISDSGSRTTSYKIKSKSGIQLDISYLSEDDVKARLSDFETKYGMTSHEFIVRYNSSAFEKENLEFMDWAGYYYMAGRLGLVV